MPNTRRHADFVRASDRPTWLYRLPHNDAWTQAARTIKIMVPVPPGGGMDILASPRLFLVREGRMQTNEEAAAGNRVKEQGVVNPPKKGTTH
jgi:hypothetical protein